MDGPRLTLLVGRQYVCHAKIVAICEIVDIDNFT